MDQTESNLLLLSNTTSYGTRLDKVRERIKKRVMGIKIWFFSHSDVDVMIK